jgi:hypothetical protein
MSMDGAAWCIDVRARMHRPAETHDLLEQP